MALKDKPSATNDIQRIEQAMLALTARTRTIFLLHRLDGLSYAEIAERCGISERRVERHIAKAMLHLDHELDDLRWPWWRRWLERWR